MKRATITIPDDLEAEFENWLGEQRARPSLTAVVQAALRSYLKPTQAREGSGDRPKQVYPVTGDAGAGCVAEAYVGYGLKQVAIDGVIYDRARQQALNQGISVGELFQRAFVREFEEAAANQPWMELAGAVDVDDEDASRSVDEVVYGREQL